MRCCADIGAGPEDATELPSSPGASRIESSHHHNRLMRRFWWTPELGQKLGRLKRESRRLSFPGYAARSLLLDAITFLS